MEERKTEKIRGEKRIGEGRRMEERKIEKMKGVEKRRR